MNDQDFDFLAYVLNKGKTSLTEAEKARLAKLGAKHLQQGDEVTVTIPTTADQVTGTIAEVREDGLIKVDLDAAYEAPGNGMLIEADSVVVNRSSVERTPDATTPVTPPAPAPAPAPVGP